MALPVPSLDAISGMDLATGGYLMSALLAPVAPTPCRYCNYAVHGGITNCSHCGAPKENAQ